MSGTSASLPLLLLLLLLLLPSCRQEEEDCNNFARLVHDKPGNVTVTGIFDERVGENCSVAAEFGTGEAAAALWTVTALDRSNYLPGIRIGMTVFDACGNAKSANEAFAEGIILESCRRENVSNIGFIASPEVDSRLASLSRKLNRTVTRLEHILDADGVLGIVSELLTNLHWTTVNRVVAESRDLLDGFARKMADEGICVYDGVLVADKFAVNNEVLEPEDAALAGLRGGSVTPPPPPVIVVLCKSADMTTLFRDMTTEMREMRARWILVPTDFALDAPQDNLPRRVFSVVPLVAKTESLAEFLADGEMQKDHMNHREATRSPLFVRVAVAILELLRPLKEVQERHCDGSTSCPELERFVRELRTGRVALEGVRSARVTPERIIEAFNALKMDITENEAFLYIASLVREEEERSEDAAIFQVFEARTRLIRPMLLILNERLFNERAARTKRTDARRIFKLSVSDIEKMRRGESEPEPEEESTYPDRHPCVDAIDDADGDGGGGNLTKWCGVCQNLVRFRGKATETTTTATATERTEREDVEETPAEAAFAWRFTIWVAINASIATIGAICTVAVTAFILFRTCKGDILEGSPHFSFLILSSVLLLYAATLPYSVDDVRDESDASLVCHLRVMAPVVAYSVLFSAVLSRSIMLAFSERDSGLVNHVNGCMQSVLCFFMCGVQVALAVQFWAYNLMERGGRCADVHAGRRFVALLVYSLFLLSLQAVAAPFIYRSKRNYSEGMFFAFATVLVVVVWCVWLSFYRVLPVEDRDAAVAFGLTGTATSVLLVVFIPRTYLMATAIVRDKITNTLPSLAFVNSSSISDANYRSTQALYDSVTVACRSPPKLAFSDARMYGVRASDSPPASPNFGRDDLALKTDDADDCALNRRKTFAEIPRSATPENAYESYESPDLTGKITKF